MDFGLLSGVGSIIGGIGSLFGKGKTSDPRSNIHSAAKGAREAAAKYGFNPLTLLQYGSNGFGGTTQGAAPPLASIDMITGGLRDINDVVSGDAERRRQADELKMDLAKLEMEKLRAGIVAVGQSGAASVGGGAPTFGRSARAMSNVAEPQVVSNPDRTSVQFMGYDTDPYMGMSDAEEYEKRYGEVGGVAFGVANIVTDVLKTFVPPAYEAYQTYIGQPFAKAVGAGRLDTYFADQQSALDEAFKNEQERKKRSAERMKNKEAL